jgi:hypothetical protein
VSKLAVLISDPQQTVFDICIFHFLGKNSRFFCAGAPVFGITQKRFAVYNSLLLAGRRRMTDRQKWGTVLLWLLFIAASFLWIDRPIAFFMHDKLEDYRAIFDVARSSAKSSRPACRCLHHHNWRLRLCWTWHDQDSNRYRDFSDELGGLGRAGKLAEVRFWPHLA